jgi:hypothetical protein
MPPTHVGGMNSQLHHLEQDYYPQNGYGPTDMSGGLPSPGLGPMHGSYAQYMGAHGLNDYQQPQYGMNQQLAPQMQYGQAPGMGPLGMNYAAAAAQPWANQGYGGLPQAQSQYPMQYPQHQVALGMHGQGEGQAWINGYGQVAPAQMDHPYLTAANANRGKTQPQVRQNKNRSANNSSTGSMKVNKYSKPNGDNNQNVIRYGQGGPVLPPVSKASKANSNPRTTSTLSQISLTSQTSSLNFHSQPVSQTVSQIASEDDTKSLSYSELGSPTPAPKARKEVGFASEIRSAQTPTLRSRRGQSIQTPATDPTHNTTAEWLNKLESRPPPKMNMELIENAISAHEENKFKSPHGSDIFTSAAKRTPTSIARPSSVIRGPPPLINNMFGAHHLTMPKPNLGEAMSPALMKLTNGARCLPTVEQALDLNNLPFAEYCRFKKPGHDFGVVKLRNVSPYP